MKSYLDARRRDPEAAKLGDFHLLLYLAELLDVEVRVCHDDVIIVESYVCV